MGSTKTPARGQALAMLLATAALTTFACRQGDAAPGTRATEPPPPGMKVATFAGGCFWCMEPPFEKLDGVRSVTSGYTGGRVERPAYNDVSAGTTGHAEAVQIVYDPAKVTYDALLEVFWRNIDPTVKDRQFCDAGTQYRSGIYVHDAEQRKSAERSRAHIEATKTFSAPIVTPIEDASVFYAAEDYHQDFYRKDPGRYRQYRAGCGRDRRLAELWGAAATAH